jgi:cytochrome c biogenesis protein CcmG/thiol:disulfide interchange protein DsbE
MRRSLLLLPALFLCCVATVVHPFHRGAAKGDEKKSGLLAVGDPAPEWTLADPAGKTHALSEYRGRVVVLDFWATWCGPCAKVMPRLEKLQKKYGGRGLVVIGVSSWDTGDPAALMKKRGITYTLLLKGEEMAPSYGVTSLPVVYVIGADGKVLYSHAGPDTKNLDELMEKQLGAQGS